MPYRSILAGPAPYFLYRNVFMSLWGSLFNQSGLTPHGFCLTWDPVLIWLHATSDAVIFLSYLAIPLSLAWLLRRRRDPVFRRIGNLFVIFIVACATTHGMEVLTLWVPAYGWEGLAKAVTAIASVVTAASLWLNTPYLAAMLSPAKLTELNAELSDTIGVQHTALQNLLVTERQLGEWNMSLEKAMAGHSTKLQASNAQLQRLVAERESNQRALARSEEEFRAAFEVAAIGKMHMEPLSGRLLRVNRSLADIFGYKDEDLVGKTVWQFVHPDDREAAVARYETLLKGVVSNLVADVRGVRHDGTAVWVRVFAVVVIDPAVGLPRLTIAEVEDIDLAVRTQATLRATEARLRLALESANYGVWDIDLRNGLVWADKRCSAMTFGTVPPETWISLLDGPQQAAWRERIHPDDRDRRALQIQAVMSGDSEMEQIETRVRRNDGGWSLLVHRCIVVEHDPATGAPVRAVGITIDMTERVAALTALEGANASLEQSLQTRREVLAHRFLLLREIYHRISDSLRTVDGLMAGSAHDRDDRAGLETLILERRRVQALRLAHMTLMEPMDVQSFEVEPLLRDLGEAFKATAGEHDIVVHVGSDGLRMPLDSAVPLALLTTELLTACTRHALPGERACINLSVRDDTDAGISLVLMSGVPGPTDAAARDSFAAALETGPVHDLLRQLGGKLEISCEQGLRVEMTAVRNTHPQTMADMTESPRLN